MAFTSIFRFNDQGPSKTTDCVASHKFVCYIHAKLIHLERVLSILVDKKEWKFTCGNTLDLKKFHTRSRREWKIDTL